jgi:hypothetical protein
MLDLSSKTLMALSAAPRTFLAVPRPTAQFGARFKLA